MYVFFKHIEVYSRHTLYHIFQVTKIIILFLFKWNLQKLSKEELADLKVSLAKYFTEGMGRDSDITSLYFVEEGQR